MTNPRRIKEKLLDEMVRDFTSLEYIVRPKSEVRRRIKEYGQSEKEKAREEERMLVYKELDIIKEGNLVRRLISNELKSLNWPEERKQSEIELSIAKHNFSSAGIDVGFNFCLSEMKQSVTDRIKELEGKK